MPIPPAPPPSLQTTTIAGHTGRAGSQSNEWRLFFALTICFCHRFRSHQLTLREIRKDVAVVPLHALMSDLGVQIDVPQALARAVPRNPNFWFFFEDSP